VTQASENSRPYPSPPSDVYLFGTCVLDLFDPEAGVSAVQLLERAGIRVHFPQDQTCCGQPAYTSGFPDEARAVAARQLPLFPGTWPVIVPSGSCAGMMRHHWPKLFADDPVALPRAESIAARTYELTEFLLNVLGWTWKGSKKATAKPETVVLHTSCSARREMGTHIHARALLAQIEGVEVRQQGHEAECCGFGGTFSVKHPEISAAMAGDKVDALLETGAERLISADAGCLLNINGTLEKRGAGLRGQHIASYLWNKTQEAT
jgi:L-lactate dehydrogenase complex protein LldE